MNLFKNIDVKGLLHTGLIVIVALVVYDNLVKDPASKLLKKGTSEIESV